MANIMTKESVFRSHAARIVDSGWNTATCPKGSGIFADWMIIFDKPAGCKVPLEISGRRPLSRFD